MAKRLFLCVLVHLLESGEANEDLDKVIQCLAREARGVVNFVIISECLNLLLILPTTLLVNYTINDKLRWNRVGIMDNCGLIKMNDLIS